MTGSRRIVSDALPRAQRWFEARTFGADRIPSRGELLERKRRSVAVVIPARNEARTIGAICSTIAAELLGGLVDELVVVDCVSSDRTAEIAALAGARVHRLERILPELPVVIGKGEAMWRSLAVVESDIVCFLDGDVRDFDARTVERLVAPLLLEDAVVFAKGFYRRPLRIDATIVPGAGGRVTELTARPLLAACYPELTAILQPLAGEIAVRTAFLREVPFATGYGVDIALVIELVRRCGLDALVQVDLDERLHRNRPLRELRAMAQVVARTILEHAAADGRLTLEPIDPATLLPDGDISVERVDLAQEVRPPMRELLADDDARANA